MSLDSYTKNGSNLQTASGILGAFWTRVFPDNGLVNSVMGETAWADTVTEGMMRTIPSWLSGKADGVMRVDRLELVPVDKAVREVAQADRGYIVGGVYADAPSTSGKWKVELSLDYRSVPLIVPMGGFPLMEGIDYQLDGRYLIFRENPAALGIPSDMQDVSGRPALCWSFLLPACVPDMLDAGSNFDFYDLPAEARESLIDLLTQEGSLSRILRFLESCAGVTPPTIFEKTDALGSYTSLESTWLEGDTLYGATSGGEIISTPAGESLLSGYNNSDNRIGLDSPVTQGIRIYEKYSEGDGPGIASGDAFLPNKTVSLDAGETGAIDPTGEWEEKVVQAMEDAGVDPDTALPGGDVNPVERLYKALNRNQPSAISLTGELGRNLSNTVGAFQAVHDSVPAGTLLDITSNVLLEDTVHMEMTDNCEAFRAIIASDNATVSPADIPIIPARTVL